MRSGGMLRPDGAMATTERARPRRAQLQRQSGTERIAEHVHPFQASGIEVSFECVHERGHGRPHLERAGLALARQVDREHVETLRQQRQDALEVVACRPETVEQQQGFT